MKAQLVSSINIRKYLYRPARSVCPALLGLALLFGIGIAHASAAAAEQNWPQWRGPLGTGVAPSANPPISWSETNNIKWKVKIPGSGSATPIIWDNRIFIQTAIPTGKKVEATPEKSDAPAPAANAPTADQARPRRGGGMGGPKPTEVYRFVVLCLDRQTGKELWQQTAREEVPHEGFKANDGTFASSSPITDGQHVFAYFGSRGMHCYDMNGGLKWSQDLGRMRIVMSFGEGSSPALAGDTLIVNWDNEEGSYIVALDKKTGKTLWKNPRDERSSWSTPLVVESNGKPQVITTATGKIRSYDVETGKIVWECGGLTRNVIPSPVAGNGLVYCTSGYQGNALLAIRLGRTGDLTGTDAIAWSYGKSTPYVPSPLLYADKLYCFANNKGMLSCFDAATGKPFYTEERIEDIPDVYASPVGAAGRIYFTGRNGVTVVVKPSDKLEVLAINRLDEKTDASPVAVGKELFLRGREYLYCITEK